MSDPQILNVAMMENHTLFEHAFGSAKSELTFNSDAMEHWYVGEFEMDDLSVTIQVEPAASTIEDLLSSRPELRRGLEAISVLAANIFGVAASPSETEVDDDPVLGGIHIVVEVPVSGLDPDEYQERRSLFHAEVLGVVDPEALRMMVITTRRDA